MTGYLRMRWPAKLFAVLLAAVWICYSKSPKFLIDTSNSPVARVWADFRSMATALESYRVDYHEYPAMVPMARFGEIAAPVRSDWTPTVLQPGEHSKYLPSMISVSGITTPISYTTGMYEDFYSDPSSRNRMPYAYFNEAKGGWILFSAGPDDDYDINPPADYDSMQKVPSASLTMHTYDSSNGTISSGDLWRTRQ